MKNREADKKGGGPADSEKSSDRITYENGEAILPKELGYLKKLDYFLLRIANNFREDNGPFSYKRAKEWCQRHKLNNKVERIKSESVIKFKVLDLKPQALLTENPIAIYGLYIDELLADESRLEQAWKDLGINMEASGIPSTEQKKIIKDILPTLLHLARFNSDGELTQIHKFEELIAAVESIL